LCEKSDYTANQETFKHLHIALWQSLSGLYFNRACPFCISTGPVRFVFQPGSVTLALQAAISDGGYKTF
jgi:hypothetical protein